MENASLTMWAMVLTLIVFWAKDLHDKHEAETEQQESETLQCAEP